MSSRPYAHVIGDPIDHSKSPLIHGFWLEKIGSQAGYSAHHVPEDGLADYLQRMRSDPLWRGCNVTMPHKQAIIPLLDHLDPLAKRVGAVNTVVRQDDNSLTGFNTDVAGFLEPLTGELSHQHVFRMARILGTGGAARAVVTALADQGMVIVLAGRDTDKAKDMIAELAPQGDHHVTPLSHFADPTDFVFDDREGCCDVIVNTTPMGMDGQPPLPFDLSHAPPGSIIYDIVTHPAQTGLLKNAQAAGFRTIDGLSMLIGQAASAFELFYGKKPPRRYDAELRRRLTV